MPGHSGGPGRPRRPVEKEYLSALNRLVTLGDWEEIVKRAIVDAKNGDPAARAWLSRHLIGNRPMLPSRLQAEEWEGLTGLVDVVVQMARLRLQAETPDGSDRHFTDVMRNLASQGVVELTSV
jgi:hypothetical protein